MLLLLLCFELICFALLCFLSFRFALFCLVLFLSLFPCFAKEGERVRDISAT